MSMKSRRQLWEEYPRRLCVVPSLDLRVDLSRLGMADEWLAGMAAPIARAGDEMARLERGERVNDDEDRMVGHYWLRDPARAPTAALRAAIEETQTAVRDFAAAVHRREIRGQRAPFEELIVVGIGGSALGPQLVAHALSGVADRLRPHFLDNTDPDGIDRLFDRLGARLERTLTIVISKSGGTKETRNGMLCAAARYAAAGLDFGRHAVAVTGDGSELDRTAIAQHFLARFPMWDWVGGRTSELSAVGLLPAALQGLDIVALLDGARVCDEATREVTARPLDNPALALALAWHFAGDGRGSRDMVILPYKDRLELMARYLQQLVMESIGKERDRDGAVVHQGIAVYGNKGSTDQHAYVQQLRDGVPNFFATFIAVLRDHDGAAAAAGSAATIEVDPGVTPGDYLAGFLQGTRRALYENGRGSITITLPDAGARSLGALIALYERAVGLYAGLVNINAYHQPGVEAGKRAASEVIALQHQVVAALARSPGSATAEELATAIAAPDEAETVFHLLEHLAANGRAVIEPAPRLTDRRYRAAAAGSRPGGAA